MPILNTLMQIVNGIFPAGDQSKNFHYQSNSKIVYICYKLEQIIFSHRYYAQILQFFDQLLLILEFYKYYYFLMSSIKKPQTKLCGRHIFSFKAKSQSCFYQQSISLKFCDQNNLKSKNSHSHTSRCYQGPTFNNDKNFLTSSFIMSSQKKKYIQSGTRCQEDQNKYQNLNQEKSQLLIPKPNSKHMHCNVCKQKYEDYQQHILQQKHKKKIRTNTFNQYILELEEKYQRIRSSSKQKETLTEASNVIIIDEESVQLQIISKPRKKAKKEEKEKRQQNRIQLKQQPTYSQGISKEVGQPDLYKMQEASRKLYWNMMQSPQCASQYSMFYNSMYPFFSPDLNLLYCMQNQSNNYIRQLTNNIPYSSQFQDPLGTLPPILPIHNSIGTWPAYNIQN